MKYSRILILSIISILPTFQSHGEIGKIVGIAKTMYTSVTGIIGSVTVTPAYALGYYDKEFTQYYGQSYYSAGKSIERDVVSNTFHYLSWSRDAYGNYWQSEESFIVPPLERSNFYCDLSYGPNLFIVMDTIDFRIDAWADSVTKTGYWPASGPYHTILKSTATEIQQNCQTSVSNQRLVRHGFEINDTGITQVAMPLVDYRYAWPMLCWVGEFYEY